MVSTGAPKLNSSALLSDPPQRLKLEPTGAIAFLALAVLVLFWRLGAASFWDPDEAHYAQTTRELIATGDWWAPYYNDQPFFDKPILFHQLQAVAMLIAGQNELGARLAPALAALALALFTGWLGAALIGLEAGILAALLLIANPGVFALARYAILDTVFAALLFAGAGLLAVSALRDRPGLQYAGYVLIAGAIMTKGPLALVLCGLTMGLAIALSSDLRRRLLSLHWVLGLGIAVAIAAPWFIYMYLRFRDEFVAGYVLDENIRLFATDRFPNQPPFWFYFQILATGMLPWTGVLIGRVVDDVRGAWSRRRTLANVDLLLWSWIIAVVGFFTFSRFKLDHYVFPAAPALCLLIARAWCDVRAAPDSADNRGQRVGFRLVGPLLVVVGLAAGYFRGRRRRDRGLAVGWPAARRAMDSVVSAGGDLCRGAFVCYPGAREAEGRTRCRAMGGHPRRAGDAYRQLSAEPMEYGLSVLRESARHDARQPGADDQIHRRFQGRRRLGAVSRRHAG
jgi:4-amino-4-deoxy-L-arabinose transferase-like glycosyltransferase